MTRLESSFIDGVFEIKQELSAVAAVMEAAGMNAQLLDYAVLYIDVLEKAINSATVILDESKFGCKPSNPESKYYYYLKVKGKGSKPDSWDYITFDGPELVAVTKTQYNNWKQGFILRSHTFI